MNMREFQNLSLRDGGRQPSGHEHSRPTLPGFDTIAATAGRGQVPTVLRPQNSYSGPQTPLGYQGAPARPLYAHGHGHFPQGVTPGYHSYAHASIEAPSPTTMFSTPRDGQNDHVYDTCSTSSSSRESSVYTRASMSSASTSKPRSTRAKRGSESQGSSDDRKPKRRSQGSHADNKEPWCSKCKCLFAECSEPKVHKPKGKKIINEQHARGEHAASLQNYEDLIQILVSFTAKKLQQPGNKKRSGCKIQKKEIFVTTDIVLNTAIAFIASFGEEVYDEFVEMVVHLVENSNPDASQSVLPAGSLLADAFGNDVCPHDAHNQPCQEPIECRKERRCGNFRRNIDQIIRSGQAGRTARTPSRVSSKSSKSSTPRRH